MDPEKELLRNIQHQLQFNQLVLPSPPELMQRIRHLQQDDNNDNEIIKLLNSDPSLAARVIKVVNSVLYRGQIDITNLRQAVSRLGMRLICTLVNSHAITQMFAQPSATFKTFLQQQHQQSLKVAANAYALARQQAKIHPEDALLAGLLHNIGYFPLVKMIEREVAHDPALAIRIMQQLYVRVGTEIVQQWKFAAHIVEAVTHASDWSYQHGGEIQLADVVIATHLTALDKPGDLPARVPALQRLGLETGQDIALHADYAQHLGIARDMLGA